MLPPSNGRGLLYTRQRARGVAGLVTPWNFPVAIPLWKAAPAIAHGNAVLLKPSPFAVATAQLLDDVLNQILPAGVFSVVPGGAETAQAVIDCSDVVSFTGSEAVGRQVIERATRQGIPVQAEMSGVNASIVLPDSDPTTVAAQIALSAMGFAGQKCTATSRIILVGDTQQHLEAIREAIDGLPFGDPAEEATVVGPLISKSAREKAKTAISQAVAQGGRVECDGRTTVRQGWWFAPTVVTGLPADHPIHDREVFAPFVTVSAVDTLDHAIEVVNSSRYGLVSSVFTANLDAALAGVAGLRTGLVRVNAPTTFVDFHAPFGGEAASSFGPREQGTAAREFFTSTQTVTLGTA